jgi:hypothetical protein
MNLATVYGSSVTGREGAFFEIFLLKQEKKRLAIFNAGSRAKSCQRHELEHKRYHTPKWQRSARKTTALPLLFFCSFSFFLSFFIFFFSRVKTVAEPT